MNASMDITRICKDCKTQKFCCVLREVKWNKTYKTWFEDTESVCPECVAAREEAKRKAEEAAHKEAECQAK